MIIGFGVRNFATEPEIGAKRPWEDVMQTKWIVGTLLFLVASLPTLASASCGDGFQPRGDVCVSQEGKRLV